MFFFLHQETFEFVQKLSFPDVLPVLARHGSVCIDALNVTFVACEYRRQSEGECE